MLFGRHRRDVHRCPIFFIFSNLECLAKSTESTWLDSAVLLRGDLPTVLTLVQQGLDSPEHAEFTARLRQPRAEPAG